MGVINRHRRQIILIALELIGVFNCLRRVIAFLNHRDEGTTTPHIECEPCFEPLPGSAIIKRRDIQPRARDPLAGGRMRAKQSAPTLTVGETL